MSVLPFDAAKIAAAGIEQLADLTTALEQCFEGMGQLEAGEPRSWEEPPEAFFGPGIAIRVETSGGAIFGLIPASFPLPEWHLQPNDEEIRRLETLGENWSTRLVPENVAVERFAAVPVQDLSELAAKYVNRQSYLTPLNPEGCDGDTLRTIYLLACPTIAAEPAAAAPVVAAEEPVAVIEPPRRSSPPRQEIAADDPRLHRLQRLLDVPVQVAVRLAEKRVQLDQLLALGPGSLITFDKNCEDLLDLYVNNRLYGRGEAVKIGEHFGLKIDEVGSVKQREERVF